jgi:ParB family chromosome partitioning protein
MRHDAHYVDELSSNLPKSIGRMVPVDQIEPNPEQPRVEIGDLTELTASIKDKGVLEPLLIKPLGSNNRWVIIAGERRWRAARASGLREVPCIEMDVDDSSVAEIALIENLQRKDLTAWEEADGLASLCAKFGYTHEDVARKIGKSRTTVTEALSIASLPEVIREECRRADISAKSLLLQIVRQPDEPSMQNMVKEIAQRSMNREEARDFRRNEQEGRESVKKTGQPFIYRYVSPEKNFKLQLQMWGEGVSKVEVINELKNVIEKFEVDDSIFDS